MLINSLESTIGHTIVLSGQVHLKRVSSSCCCITDLGSELLVHTLRAGSLVKSGHGTSGGRHSIRTKYGEAPVKGLSPDAESLFSLTFNF